MKTLIIALLAGFVGGLLAGKLIVKQGPPGPPGPQGPMGATGRTGTAW